MPMGSRYSEHVAEQPHRTIADLAWKKETCAMRESFAEQLKAQCDKIKAEPAVYAHCQYREQYLEWHHTKLCTGE